MKTLGIVGGIGPESTIEYYRTVIRLCRERAGPENYPPIIINSINVARMLGMIQAGQLRETADYILDAVGKLARAGADLGLIAANTPHIVFDEIAGQSPIPLISIVQATCDAAKAMGLRKLALLGTGPTMKAGFYQKHFAALGMAIVVPSDADQARIHDRYMAELVQGIFREETRSELLSIVDRLVAEHSVQAVILGGTELPLLFRASTHGSVPLLDTTHIHAERAVSEMVK
jgi:aspartate racemase